MSQPGSGQPSKKAFKRKKQKRLTAVLVIAVLLALMLLVALLLGNNGTNNSNSTIAGSSTTSVPQSGGGSTVSVPVSTPLPQAFVPEPVGPFDEPSYPVLFNANRKIPDDYVLNLQDIGDNQRMDTRAAQAFIAMQAAAANDGVTLTPISGYRTHERQTTNYEASINNYLNQGYTQEEAERLTRRYYAVPGTSEHEAGLAIDINSIEDSFDQTEAYTWLQQHCSDYGFILRYKAEWEEITGIAYEPWHYRYVGSNHAKAIESFNITLEEYTAKLEGQEFSQEKYGG